MMLFGHHNNCRREGDEAVCLDCTRRFSIDDEVYPPCEVVPVLTLTEATAVPPTKLTKEICDQMLLHGNIAGYYELTTMHGLISYCLYPMEAQLFELRNRGGVVKWVDV